MIPCKRFAHLINDILNNRFVKVYLNNESSKWKRLNNGLPQTSRLNSCPNSVQHLYQFIKSTKFGYADDLALLIEFNNFEDGEIILEDDLSVLLKYYTT